MRVELRHARTRGEILRCQSLIASVYNVHYGVVFSEDRFDLDAKIEPWPHRYLMMRVGEDLAACAGLYVGQTYTMKFGDLSEADVLACMAAAGAPRQQVCFVEVTKLVVSPEYRGHRLGQVMIAAAHADANLRAGDVADPVAVCCSKLSILRTQYDPAGVRTRPLKAFPYYKVHEHYRSPEDPMESRLTIPELDIPDRWRTLAIPGTYALDELQVTR